MTRGTYEASESGRARWRATAMGTALAAWLVTLPAEAQPAGEATGQPEQPPAAGGGAEAAAPAGTAGAEAGAEEDVGQWKSWLEGQSGKPGAEGTAPAAGKPEEEADSAKAGPVQGGEYRRIGDHNFIPPQTFPGAITNTSIGSSQGFGAYFFKLPTFELGVDPTGVPTIVEGKKVDKTLLLYAQRFLGQIGILNRVSIDVEASGIVAVGGDLDTVLVLGATGIIDAGLMPKVRIFTAEDLGLQMAVGVGVGYSRAMTISPINVLATLITEGELDESRIVLQQEEVGIQPGVYFAEGIGAFGAQLALALGIGAWGTEITGSYENTISAMPGIALELDIAELTEDVPIGLQGEYALDFEFNDSDAYHELGAGLFYTGRRDLALGAISRIGLSQPADGDPWTILIGQVVLHYYF